jgi:hypothetical protein
MDAPAMREAACCFAPPPLRRQRILENDGERNPGLAST